MGNEGVSFLKKNDWWVARITSIEHVVRCKKSWIFYFSKFSLFNIAGFITVRYRVYSIMLTAEYSQEVPGNKPWEKVSGPPILPPHLLQVILNKDTPLSVSFCVPLVCNTETINCL